MEKSQTQQPKIFICKVQNCPMERDDVPTDDKFAHKNALKNAFGDMKVVGCETIYNQDKKKLFCEMVIRSNHDPDKTLLPVGFSIVDCINASD